MVSKPTRSFTYLVLLFVTFTLKTWSSLLPDTSLNIESASTGVTLSIASGSPNPEIPIDCYPPLSSRGPFLNKGNCQQAVTEFYRRSPSLDPQGFVYTLTHGTTAPQPVFPIECPCVIAHDDCVFTLDYLNGHGGDVPNIHTHVIAQWGSRIARACVGKHPEQLVDGGEAVWEWPGTVVRISLAHIPKPLESAYGNSTSVGNGSAALVSSAESNLTVDTDTNVPVEISDSK